MEAIPRGLVSRDMIKMIPGIKCLRTNILPSHHSGNHQFTSTASNKVTFQIPSFPNSYINTKRSFIRFVLKTSANGVLVPQANPFRRLLTLTLNPIAYQARMIRATTSQGERQSGRFGARGSIGPARSRFHILSKANPDLIYRSLEIDVSTTPFLSRKL